MGTVRRGSCELAQLNISRLRAPMGEPRMAALADALARIDALAEASPGFVWHAAAGGEHFHHIDDDDKLLVASLSVWATYADLHVFLDRTEHEMPTTHRRRWFEPVAGPTAVLWWVKAGARPSLDDGLVRLERLRTQGASPDAFSLLTQFDERRRPVARRALSGTPAG